MKPWTIRNYNLFHQVVLISPRTTAFTAKLWGENIKGMKFDESESQVSKDLNYDKAIEDGIKYGAMPRQYGKNEKYIRAFINFWQPTYFKATFIQYGFRIEKWSLKHNLMGLLF